MTIETFEFIAFFEEKHFFTFPLILRGACENISVRNESRIVNVEALTYNMEDYLF